MQSAHTESSIHSIVFQAVCRLRCAAWCFVPINTDSISVCSQGFLDVWGLHVDLAEVSGRGLSLIEGRVPGRLQELGMDPFWLMRVCRTADRSHFALPEAVPISRVDRTVVFDHQRFPIGTLITCLDRTKVEIPENIWSRAVDFRQKLTGLSKRETDVLELVYEGLTNREVGERVEISPKTIEKHRASIMRKLKIRGIVELIRRMTEASLVPSEDLDPPEKFP
ncbi:MAG: helix-turn-helix transcriptional regulator [Planctomycetaceae bacterium]